MMRQNWADIEDDPMPARREWANVEDDEEPGRRVVSYQADEKGIRTEIEYCERNAKAVKITTTYKQRKVTKKSNRFVDARRLWTPFGRCVDPAFYSEYGSNKPVRAEEDIKIELNKEKVMKSIGQEEKFWESSIKLCEDILNDAKKRKYDANEMRRRREMEATNTANNEPTRDRIHATGGALSTMAGKYVPPSLRGADGGPQRDDRNENTLRVTNLSEDTREGDLQNLFGACGRVTRVFMPKHKEGEREGQHKGFAFINFADRRDGEKAIKKLHGHGYDSLILQVSWAQPRAA